MKTITGKNKGVAGIHFVVACIVILLLTGSTILGQWVFGFLNSDKIYDGIYIAGFDASGMSPDEAKHLLIDRVRKPAAGTTISLESELGSRSFTLAEIEYSYDVENAVKKAYSIGRNGNILRRMLEIVAARANKVNIELDCTYSQEKLENIIEQFYEETLIKMKESDIVITEDTITVYSGHRGMQIDREKALQLVQSAVENPHETTIDIPIIVTVPSKIDVEKVHQTIFREPRDAFFRIENNQVVIEPHINGRSIDWDVLFDFIEEAVRDEDSIRTLTLDVIEPSITKEEAEQRLFTDILAEYSTKFYTGNENDRNRGENIRLATAKINNTILAPGDVFPFNEVVGPRTAEAGYKVAHVYTAGEVVDDIGGGICQVSSTLYVVSLLADLETVERWNHVFTVSYVPLGQDATVSYGSVDFKFRNSTGWPVRIEGEVTDDNEVIFRIVGTNEEPGKTVELVSEIKSTTPYNTVYIDDPNLLEGVEIVKQEGKEGYTVDTQKIVKNDDTIISNAVIHRSYYKPLTRQIRRGTKKPSGNAGEAGEAIEAGEAGETGEAIEAGKAGETGEPDKPQS